jgi:hypothetical protein
MAFSMDPGCQLGAVRMSRGRALENGQREKSGGGSMELMRSQAGLGCPRGPRSVEPIPASVGGREGDGRGEVRLRRDGGSIGMGWDGMGWAVGDCHSPWAG